ncbi:TetR/AcrR family transcriptional regulator [Deinococcus hohokamensis]|uniref:TetR/AcrR family transcriptional regulator n=1 Tax=Deinococcus hohokamensis TaxID=309883 RepID=A0ABV9IFE6_9DEIO
MALRGDTQTALLNQAQELIQTQSFLGLTLQEVADQVGIKKATIFHYFPSKEALGLAVMRRSAQAFRHWAERQSGTPEQQLTGFVRMFRDTLGAGRKVCPAGAFAPGWDCTDPELQQAVLSLRTDQLAWLTQVFEQSGQPAEAARRSALQVYALCQGALLTARVSGNPADFDDAVTGSVQSLLDP